MDDEVMSLASARERLAARPRGYAVVIDGGAVAKVLARWREREATDLEDSEFIGVSAFGTPVKMRMDDEVMSLASARERLAARPRGYAVVIDGGAVACHYYADEAEARADFDAAIGLDLWCLDGGVSDDRVADGDQDAAGDEVSELE